MIDASSRPRTPVLLYLLAFLVVGAVWTVYDVTRDDGSTLDDWRRRELSFEEIRSILDDPKAESSRVGHALVQLSLIAERQRRDVPPRSDLLELLPRLDAIARDGSIELRQLTTPALTFIDDPESGRILTRLLDDSDPKVALNAAIGLAFRGDDGGADLLSEAIEHTRGDQSEARRNLLHTFRLVAGERHRGILEEQQRLAELDRDEVTVRYCEGSAGKVGFGLEVGPGFRQVSRSSLDRGLPLVIPSRTVANCLNPDRVFPGSSEEESLSNNHLGAWAWRSGTPTIPTRGTGLIGIPRQLR